MILSILELLTQAACIACIFFGFRASIDAYKCYEINSNYIAAVFLAVAYLFINNSYGQSSVKIDDSVSIMYRLFHLCMMLFVTRICAEKSQSLRSFCPVNFNKSKSKA